MKSRRFRAIVFDLDGTLVHTRQVYPAAYAEALEPYLGRPFTTGDLAAMRAATEGRPLRLLAKSEDFERVKRDFVSAYMAAFDRLAEPWPDWPALLRPLWRLAPLAVFTGKSRETANFTLERLGLAGFFRIVITEDDIERPKPDPSGLAEACRLLDIPPLDVLYWADTWTDLGLCRALGAPMAAAAWFRGDPRYWRRWFAPRPIAVFSAPEDFVAYALERLAE